MKPGQANILILSFSLTILLSAFLLFLIQPLIGKYILPWFGGTSFVWITSLLFFQTVLLGGYLYSFLLTKLPQTQQITIHTLLILGSLLTISVLFSQWTSPITPPVDIKVPDSVSPVLQVLAVLGISVGLPYFLLSTTSTLLQRWFSLLPHKKSPYPLYALSNIGSLVAIATYPFVIEPFLPLPLQGQLWSQIFLLLCLLLLFCTWQLFGKGHTSQKLSPVTKSKLTKNHIFLWLFLPAVSSLVLLSGTHQLTQGIAPIPFLWLIPLGLYLVSFILCFSERQFYKRTFYAYTFLLSLPIVLSMILQPTLLGVLLEFCFYSLLLFSCFMICHGELFASKPETDHLNAFYLLMATGSVIGSLVVAIIAPIFFVGLFWEFLLGLWLATLIAILIPISNPRSLVYRGLTMLLTTQKEMHIFLLSVMTGFYFIFGIGMLLAQMDEAIGIWRNFYGTLRVLKDDKRHTLCLLNGKIIHGCQSTLPKERRQPTTYFGENSVGLAVKSIRQSTKTPISIGVIGLGVGTIAAYGEKGDLIKFYELNPLDVTIAKKYFTYLTESPATVETIVGDGRLSLEKELAAHDKQNFHLFIVDAFNDDAIPVHLLTKEAFAVYKNHMANKGIIAVHISNGYLDLTPVVKKAAAHHTMYITFIDAPPKTTLQTRSRWAFLSNDQRLINTKELQKVQISPSKTEIHLWTDNYSNLFQILHYFPT